MLIFQPNSPQMVYAKQILHADELPFFIYYELSGEVFFSGRTDPFYCLEKNLNPNFAE